MAPAVGRIAKIFGARLAAGGNLDVEPVLGNINAQRRGNHTFVLLPLTPSPRSPASIYLVHRICAQSASQDTVQPAKRSLEKRGLIYRTRS